MYEVPTLEKFNSFLKWHATFAWNISSNRYESPRISCGRLLESKWSGVYFMDFFHCYVLLVQVLSSLIVSKTVPILNHSE